MHQAIKQYFLTRKVLMKIPHIRAYTSSNYGRLSCKPNRMFMVSAVAEAAYKKFKGPEKFYQFIVEKYKETEEGKVIGPILNVEFMHKLTDPAIALTKFNHAKEQMGLLYDKNLIIPAKPKVEMRVVGNKRTHVIIGGNEYQRQYIKKKSKITHKEEPPPGKAVVTRDCQVCKVPKPKDCFAHRQWSKDHDRLCNNCKPKNIEGEEFRICSICVQHKTKKLFTDKEWFTSVFKRKCKNCFLQEHHQS